MVIAIPPQKVTTEKYRKGNDTPIATSKPAFILMPFSNKRSPGLLKKGLIFRTGARNPQNDPGPTCSAKKEERAQQKGWRGAGVSLPMSKAGTH